MEMRTFGETGMEVTTLGYGAMALRKVDDSQAERLLNEVLDGGINFIDTAPDYGASEDLIGKFIAHRRDEYFLATKCGCNVPRQGWEDAPNHIWTGEQLRHNIEHSLRRLKTDYVDVWQIHSANPEDLVSTDVIETMQAIRDEGKVRHIAVSMAGRSEGYGYVQLQGYLGWDVFEAMQVWYSAVIRYSERAISEAASQGWGTIIRGLVRQPYDVTLEEGFERASLDELRAPGESRMRFLIRFAISHPDLHTAIIGTSSLDHLAENIAAVEAGPLAGDVLLEARQRLSEAGFTVGIE
jgi:aryl-alcohol dehydrogenase-like predicted oxidoreductase